MFSSDIYVQRRAALAARLEGGLVVLQGNGLVGMNYRHNHYGFRQDGSFRYFCGIDRPDLTLILDLDVGKALIVGDDPGLDSVVWTGPREALADQAARAGIDTVLPRAELPSLLRQARDRGRRLHLLPPYRGDHEIQRMQWLDLGLDRLGELVSEPLIRAVAELRLIKGPEEIAELEQALALAAEMHHVAMARTRPGVRESAVVGAIMEVVARHQSQLSYPVIFSRRGEILHNERHDQILERGDWVVNDCGANSPLGYASDITRTIPVGGSFEGIKADLYAMVARAQQDAIELMAPGVPFRAVHDRACQSLVAGLTELGLFKGSPAELVARGAHALVFQCGTGHPIGLDVHDMEGLGEQLVGYGEGLERSPLFGHKSLRFARPLKASMVMTVEPGIYFNETLIRTWAAEGRFKDCIDYGVAERLLGLGGVRLEDEVLVTDDGHRLLGPTIAKAPEDIAAIMNG
ncbi:aminopeptidase P family protein [Gallaecimonas sp. GXIMD4217]|uniref:aminopeptidase P family protein n=1 Tax=Gallaecimonas sp. GXIMD4217 TaxID=3131927 RepID=UPI00311AFFA4